MKSRSWLRKWRSRSQSRNRKESTDFERLVRADTPINIKPEGDVAEASTALLLIPSHSQLTVILHVDPQTILQGVLRISGRELLFVVTEEEVEWIFGIHVDQHHVGVVHGEFAETQLPAEKCHIVSTAFIQSGLSSARPENQ